MQLLKPTTYATADEDSIIMYPAQVLPQESLQESPQELPPQDEPTKLEMLWDTAIEHDDQYKDARQAVLNGEQSFPPSLELKVSIAECTVDENLHLTFRS